jgi:hypothetical protein
MIRKIIGCMLVALMVVGCGKLPRPFERAEQGGNSLADNIFLDAVSVPPVSGSTLPMGKLLSSAVAKTLEKKYEIPAAVEGLSRSRFLLTGEVVLNAPNSGAPTEISVHWKLNERDKALIGDFIQDIDVTKTEWDYGSPQVIELIGNDAGERTARLVLGDRFGAAGQDRMLGRRGVHLSGITGAPGDGRTALRRAMFVALAGAGIAMTPDPETAVFQVNGTVEMGPPDNGGQAIRIAWDVSDVNGQQLGRAAQANIVPAGSLDGPWGQTAAFIAAAAVDGVIDIIDKHDPTQLRAPDLGGGPAKPIGPSQLRQLEQIPGRAPPPPS